MLGISGWAHQAAVREVMEETGLSVELLDLVGVYDTIEKDEMNRVRYNYVVGCFTGKKIGGKLRPSSEVGNVGWFGAHELERLDLTQTTRRALKDSRIL